MVKSMKNRIVAVVPAREGSERLIIRIGENPDGYVSSRMRVNFDFKTIEHKNLPRAQFLGLLKNCNRYITNSSSAYYEAMPLDLKREQIVLVGNRNKNRSSPMEWKQDYKTSERICQILKAWWLKKNGK